MNALLTLFACLIQDPTPAVAPQPPRTARLDVLELKNGEQLVGRIGSELDGYVEIVIDNGAKIGVSRAMVATIRKGAVEAPRRAAIVRDDDAWFVLHDADGRSVGWLHSSVQAAGDGSFTVNEEYEFVHGVRRYQVTTQCRANPDGRGRSCYYRERCTEPKQIAQRLPGVDPMAVDERIVDERIVEAEARDDLLQVMHLDNRGRQERTLPWGPTSTFPLLARILARHTSSVIGPVSMFDPADEQLVVRRVDGTGARTVMIDGEATRVGEIAETTAAGRNREWVDANLNTLRRELAGPSLVAVPSDADSVRHAVGASKIASAIVAEADGRFGIWVPSMAWQVERELPAGHLQLRCRVHDAEIRVALLDHLAPNTLLETAAEAVRRWFALLHPDQDLHEQTDIRVRGRPAIHMQGGDARRRWRSSIDVIPFEDRFLVLVCRAPHAAWDELAPDFGFVRRSLELDRRALEPKPQGPLRPSRTGKVRTGPMPTPTAAPRIGGQSDSNNVRIPK